MTEDKRLCIDGPYRGQWFTASDDMILPSRRGRFIKYKASEISFPDSGNIKIWVCGEITLGRIVECLDGIIDGQ